MKNFNIYGLVIMVLIMIPNIIYALKIKEEKRYSNKVLETIEQIGRYGCLFLMIYNIPYTYTNFYFNSGLTLYLIINGILLFSYIIIWILLFNKNTLFKACSLSILPSLIFIISAILLGYIPLLILSIIFSISHITISIKNYKNSK